MDIKFWALIFSIIATAAALFSLWYSYRANKLSQEANKLSQEVITQTETHFRTLNKPLLEANPIPFQPDNSYFHIKHIEEKKIIISVALELKNVGHLTADDIQLHSTVSFLYLNNNTIGGHRISEYEQLGDKLSWMDITPNGGIVKIIDLEFQLRSDLDIQKLPKALSLGGKLDPNFFFKYYCTIDNEKHEFHLNTSFEITYQWYGVLCGKL